MAKKRTHFTTKLQNNAKSCTPIP